VREPGPPALLLSDLSQAWGYTTMLLLWLCIMHGLRCYETPRDARLRAIGREEGASRFDKTVPWPPKHHPLGEVRACVVRALIL
jgi:hypothetical protein